MQGTPDISGFAEAIQQAVALAQAGAADLTAAMTALSTSSGARLESLSLVAATSADSVKASLAGAASSSREASETIASAFAPVTEAGARLFGAWLRGGRDFQREFAGIVQSMISELARSGLPDLIFGAKAGSPAADLFGTRSAGGGIFGVATGAFQDNAIQQALDRAWRGISGTISEVFSNAFNAAAGTVSSLFGSAFSGVAMSAITGSAGGAVSAVSSAAENAAETTALAANTTALGILSAAMAANTIALEQLAVATEIDATSHLLAFESGGIVPSAAGGMVLGGRGTLAILHPREMVLPAPLSEGIQSAISGGRLGEQSGGDVHIHIGSIHGGNAVDVRRELDRFADRIGDIVREQHRAGRFLGGRY